MEKKENKSKVRLQASNDSSKVRDLISKYKKDPSVLCDVIKEHLKE
jgi:hypothetical protein